MDINSSDYSMCELCVGNTRRHVSDLANVEECEIMPEDHHSSLHVMNAGSCVGSAVSLTSICTAQSVGLLSNDTEDDFLDSGTLGDCCRVSACKSVAEADGDGLRISVCRSPVFAGATSSTINAYSYDRIGQRRRLLSCQIGDSVSNHCEKCCSKGHSPRTSYSQQNLTTVEQPVDSSAQVFEGYAECETNVLLTEVVDDNCVHVCSSFGKPDDLRGQNANDIIEMLPDCKNDSIVSYNKAWSSMTECRIRQWLQEVDALPNK